MNLAALVPILLQVSIFAIVFAMGLGTTLQDATWAFRKPKALGITVLAMFVIMPIIAILVVLAFALPRPVEIALVAISLSPIPPILPKKELKAGGEASRAFGLLVAAALLSVVTIPAGLEIIQRITGNPLDVPPAVILRIVGLSVLLPMAAGLLVHAGAPAIATRIAGPLGKLGGLLLVAGALPILFAAGPAMWRLVGDGTLLAITGFIVAGLAVGHFLAGGRGEDRTVLALSTATRHPGVAIAIATANFPDERLIAPAVLLYLVLGAVVSGIYLAVRRKTAGEAKAHATA